MRRGEMVGNMKEKEKGKENWNVRDKHEDKKHSSDNEEKET